MGAGRGRQAGWLAAGMLAWACRTESVSSLPEEQASAAAGQGAAGAAGGQASGGTGDGGAGAGGTPAAGGPLTYHRDARAIIARRCNGCHKTGGSGPFTMSDYKEVVAHAKEIGEQVRSGEMPPWLPDDGCSRYVGDLSMPAAEKATVLSWLDQGAAEGSPADYRAPADPGGEPAFRADRTIKMSAPYRVLGQGDEYRCFLLPWTPTQTTFVTGFALRPGNPEIVHHAIVDIVAPADAAAVRAKDGKDGRPGFACGQQGASLDWLVAWGPGGQAQTFGSGDQVGTRLEPGTLLALQMHYHVHQGTADTSDQTQVDLQLSDRVEREGQFVQVLDPRWPAGNMPIAAGDANAVHSVTVSPLLAYGIAAGKFPSAAMGIYQVAAHMHQRGMQASLRLRQGAADACLLDIPRWDFNWQNAYRLAQPVAVGSGDQLTVTCRWDNSAAHQPKNPDGPRPRPCPLNGGVGSDDEMCLGFLYMAPL